MKFEEISITTAKIIGLNSLPYYFDSKCFWAWNISFCDAGTLLLNNIPWIYLCENSEEEARKNCNELKEQFFNAGIYEGNEVAVLFEEDGSVIAIGRIGFDSWIDVRDHFTKKTFKELNIIITSLKVH